MLVAGVDSSTQSCKVLIVDAESGELIRSGSAAHPQGTEVHPEHWWTALQQAIAAAGGLKDVSAIGIGGQQHGMVLLDNAGRVVREALLWNDTRSAVEANQLVSERSAEWWAAEIGSVPVASFTVTKIAWVRQHEPEIMAKTSAVCLPHDWLIYRLRGGEALVSRVGLDSALTTDRGDASGTGYWSTPRGEYDVELIEAVVGKSLSTPQVLGPWHIAGQVDADVAAELGINPDAVLSVGSGDNMAAALGLGATPGRGIVSLGTSGTVFASSETPTRDASGLVAGFADATGNFLPLACTLNATQVLDRLRALTGLGFDEFDAAALAVAAGADGLTLIPYLQGERTPNRPDATGTLHGMTLSNLSPGHLARAGIEGVLCSLNDALGAIRDCGVKIDSLSLIGGGAVSSATQQIAAAIFGQSIAVPLAREYVAYGMARQAATALGADASSWSDSGSAHMSAPASPHVFDRYRELRG